MRHRHHRYRLGRVTAHRLAMVRNLLVALFRHERITTTETKAKAVRPLADRVVTLAKQESLHARRQALAMVPDSEVVARLFDTIAARFSDRHGGYTRIIKNGVRRGDAAPLVFLELVDRVDTPADKGKGKDKGDRKGKAPKGRAETAGKGKKKKEKAAASA
jgi:large subunit ribosomal protein L17